MTGSTACLRLAPRLRVLGELGGMGRRLMLDRVLGLRRNHARLDVCVRPTTPVRAGLFLVIVTAAEAASQTSKQTPWAALVIILRGRLLSPDLALRDRREVFHTRHPRLQFLWALRSGRNKVLQRTSVLSVGMLRIGVSLTLRNQRRIGAERADLH